MKKLSILTLLTLFIFGMSSAAQAQDGNELSLSLSRDFGYSSGTGKIQGTFSLKVKGPEDLARVEFLIDGKSIGEATQPPFNLQFNTDDYSLGVHTMTVVGFTVNGQELHSNEVRAEFVSATEGWQSALKIAIPIIAVALIAVLLSSVGPLLLGRGKKSNVPLGSQRSYGVLGGTICPKCGHPFSVHVWGINMLVGKLDRCPYCGKWSIVRRYPITALREAEVAELEDAKDQGQVPTLSEEEKLHKELEDSRFRDL
jgi:hypothetical protein